MSCAYPLWTYDRGKPITYPCGRCIGCKLDRSKDWALRCVHEASLHEENCFITLTYRTEDLPKNLSVSKETFRKFVKKLRKYLHPKRIRFYGCGEYGKKHLRPHYHLLIFGHDFEDKEVLHVADPKKRNRFSTVKDPYIYYTSETLAKLWKKGFHSIGEVNNESAGYVARYCTKKVIGVPGYYDGVEPEFALMSRRPGIGAKWIEKYMSDCYPKDFVTHNRKKFKPPRFYDDRLLKRDYKMWEGVKEKRKENVNYDDGLRRQHKEKYLKEITKNLERSYESDG